jgi:hypothetical protein
MFLPGNWVARDGVVSAPVVRWQEVGLRPLGKIIDSAEGR